MKKDLESLKKLKDHIIGIEMAIALIQSDLVALDKDVEFLNNLILMLEENIQILKSDKIIAVAAEYKRITEELASAHENMEMCEHQRFKLLRDQDRYSKSRDIYVAEFEKDKKAIDNQNTVLVFDLSKRKNK